MAWTANNPSPNNLKFLLSKGLQRYLLLCTLQFIESHISTHHLEEYQLGENKMVDRGCIL